MFMQVTLSQPAKLELVDEEIITLAGCDLGFITLGKPPQVLQVEPGSEMAAHSIRIDDVLVGVDGRDTRGVSKDELENLLRAASRLSFERPKSDGDVEMQAQGGDLHVDEDIPPKEVSADSEAPTPAPETAAAEAAPAPAPASAPVSPAHVTAPLARAPVAQHLRTGMLVRLVGFQSAAMNGARGRLGKYSEKQGSWQVFLESTSAAKAVRAQNLEALSPEEVGGLDVAMGSSHSSSAAGAGGPGANGIAASAAAAALAASPLAAALAAMRGVVPVPAHVPLHWDGPGPPPGPEWQEEVVPADEDKESWVELMRDAYVRQLRADAEYPEPPPFHRANHFGAATLPGQSLPEGKYPTQALNFQLQMLLRARTGDFPAMAAMHHGHGGGGGGYWSPARRMGKGFGGMFGAMPRGPPRWMPLFPGGASGGFAGGPGEAPRIVFPPGRA